MKELRKRDNLLLQQSKNAALGELIANIAHQWRQPLANLNGLILNFDYDVRNEQLEKKEILAYLNDMEKLSIHMSKTIEDFMNYFKPHKEKTTFEIEHLFNEIYNLLHYSMNKQNINLTLTYRDQITLSTYYAELFQVLITLINNAKDALLLNKINNGSISIYAEKTDETIFITVEDNAGGISEDIMERIFEPYFTTKHKSDGTGLGLHIVNTLVTTSFKRIY